MKKTAILLIAVWSIATMALAQIETPSGIKDRFGFYHWDGTYLAKTSEPLLEGAQRVKESGSRVINIVLSPYWDYNLGERFESSSLTLRARRADYTATLCDPAFSTILITVFDWASYPKKFLNLPQDSELRRRFLEGVSNEIANLVVYIATTCNGQIKNIIIKDWETEHTMGVTYDQSTDLSQSQTDTAKWQDYLEYIVARQHGVEQGRRRAEESGMTTVRFYNAVETVNIYPLFDVMPKEDSILWQMSQKNIGVDLVSFSGWQAIWGADPLSAYFNMKTALKKVADFIQSNGIAQKMFLGEAGILDSYNSELLRYIYDAVEENPDVVLMVKWNLYNVESAGWLGVFGNYDAFGRITPQGVFMTELLNGRLPKINRGGVIDAVTHENQTQPGGIIEIYGQNFPEEISRAKVLLALGASKYVEVEVLYASSTQINAKILELPELFGRTAFVKVNNSNFQPIFIGTPGP